MTNPKFNFLSNLLISKPLLMTLLCLPLSSSRLVLVSSSWLLNFLTDLFWRLLHWRSPVLLISTLIISCLLVDRVPRFVLLLLVLFVCLSTATCFLLFYCLCLRVNRLPSSDDWCCWLAKNTWSKFDFLIAMFLLYIDFYDGVLWYMIQTRT